jgi:putative serine/threonine protein kinase
MKPPAVVPIECLNAEPYASIVCYPRVSAVEMEERLCELRQLGVEWVEFDGKASAFSVPVLGKGYVGIVVVAYVGGKRCALKMQRVDSDRESLLREAELLKLANTVGVGPKFLGVTKHFLLMELVDGGLIEEWLQIHTAKTEVQAVLVDILEQCWRLDTISLDHGELSKAPKHLLLNSAGKSFIVDFETASTIRNASNVTSVCQYLFMGQSEACVAIAQALGERDKDGLVAALRGYRKHRNRQNFEALARLCLEKPDSLSK